MFQKNRCVILTGGPMCGASKLRELLLPDDYIVCADGGLDHAEELKVQPDILVGDFDSVRARFPQGVKILRYKKEKDETDTILAIEYGLEAGYTDFLLLGGLKGRLDHTVANFSSLLFLLRHGGHGYFADGDCQAHMLLSGKAVLQNRPGYYVSVFPFGEKAVGVTETGMKYPLENATLTGDFPLGVSNEFTTGDAAVSVEKGPLLILLVAK